MKQKQKQKQKQKYLVGRIVSIAHIHGPSHREGAGCSNRSRSCNVSGEQRASYFLISLAPTNIQDTNSCDKEEMGSEVGGAPGEGKRRELREDTINSKSATESNGKEKRSATTSVLVPIDKYLGNRIIPCALEGLCIHGATVMISLCSILCHHGNDGVKRRDKGKTSVDENDDDENDDAVNVCRSVLQARLCCEPYLQGQRDGMYSVNISKIKSHYHAADVTKVGASCF